jgi:general secretion pathway protein G
MYPRSKLQHGRTRKRGFTLIELLIVMVILGLLASIVVPKMFGHVDSAKVDTTRTQLSSLETALDAFRLDVGRYPTSDEGLTVIVNAPADDSPGASHWRGPYLKHLPKDAWGNPFQYKAPGQHGDYDLWSNGPSGKEGSDDNVTSWEGDDASAQKSDK